MSRLKLLEFFIRRGVTAVVSLFVAFSIIVAGTYSWVSLVHKASNEFEYNPELAPLRITKKISLTDINGTPYSDADLAKDKLFPFEFTVIIGKKEKPYDDTVYKYRIVKEESGKAIEEFREIAGYGYPENPADLQAGEQQIRQESSGTIKSGDMIYLRHGEMAIIEGIEIGTAYLVQESPYINLDDIVYEPEYDQYQQAILQDAISGDGSTGFDFGCEDSSDEGYKHKAYARLPGGGWTSNASNAEGKIVAADTLAVSSKASFTNTRVPSDYPITISSLVVVDRIVEDDETLDHRRGQAPPQIIDYSQPFPVTVVVGDVPEQSYYYEVVHIEETEQAIDLKEHEDKDDYYIANDPHKDWHATVSTRLFSVLQAGSLKLNGLWAGLLNILPLPPLNSEGFYEPLHKPSDYERRLERSSGYDEGVLTKSKGNTITVELHHQSALIVYGIPTLTEYKVEQTRDNGIYTLHSYYKEVGAILPDLDAVPDPHFEEYKDFATEAARVRSGEDPPALWRTRADIFNHPPQGAKTIEVEKKWQGGTNRPTVVVDIINIDTGQTATTVKLSGNDWKASTKVPLYNEDGSDSYYKVEEKNVPRGYIASVTGNEDNGFIVTNIYYTVNIDDEEDDSSAATGEKARLTVTKTVQGAAGAERYKRFDFTVTIGRYKYKITLADGEKYTFTNIPVGTKYSVTEASYTQEGYATTSTGAAGSIARGGNTAAFVNTKDIPATGNGSLTVTKTIAGQFVDTMQQFRFVAQIGQKKHTFTLRHGESKTFADIPAGTSYQVTEDDYSAESYVTTATNATGTIVAGDVTTVFVNEYTGDSLPVPEGAVQIKGTKTWEHGSNTEHPDSIQVFVMNGSDIVTRKTVTAKENWKYAFNLPKYGSDGTEILYSINEEPVKKYIKSINGYDITNTYDPGQNPGTGGGRVMWIWFIVLAAGSLGLRLAVFYRNKRKGTL